MKLIKISGIICFILILANTALAFSDDFNRANSNDVGNDWQESENSASNILITSNYMSVNGVSGYNIQASHSINNETPYQLTDLQFRYYIDHDGSINAFNIGGVDENGTNAPVIMLYSNSGRLNFYSGGGWYNACPSLRFTWYLIELRDFNWTAKTVDFWCAGAKIYDNVGISFPTAIGATNFSTAMNNPFLGEIRIDDYDDYIVTCTPNWTCSGYGTCNESDLQPCNAVTDQNTCGESYGGDYSEFTPQACDFCTPDWNCTGYEDCISPMPEASCDEVEDLNICGEAYTGNYSEFGVFTCIYPPAEGGSPPGASSGSYGEYVAPREETVIAPSPSGWDSLTDQQQKIIVIGGMIGIGWMLIRKGIIKI